MPISRRLSVLVPLVAATVASAADTSLQFHGFASQGYIRSGGDKYEDNGAFGRDTNRGSFEFNEIALNALANPVDRLRIGIQIISYDLGKVGNNQPQLDWGFGEYQVPIAWEDLRVSFVAGRFKTGHAFYNDYRDLDMTRTAVFLPSPTYSATFRDFFLASNGGQLNASLDLHAAGSVDVSGFIGTQNVDESRGPLADTFRQGLDQEVNVGPIPFIPGGPGATMNLQVTTQFDRWDSFTIDRMSGGNLTWNTPLDGLRIKGSSLYAQHMRAVGKFNSITKTTITTPGGSTVSYQPAFETVTTDIDKWFDITAGVEYQIGDLTLATEGTWQHFTGTSVAGTQTVELTSRNAGGYVSATYQLSSLPGAWSRLSVYGSGSYLRASSLVDDESFSYDRGGAVALRYDVTDHFLVKGQFDRTRDTDTTGDTTYGSMFSLKTTFDF